MTEILPADRLPCPWPDEDQSAARLREQLAGKLDWSAVRQHCEPWIQAVRRHPGAPWALESLLHEFPLSSHEGLAVMRLAEALLRVPDNETALALTADQLNRPLGTGFAPDTGWLGGITHRVLSLSRLVLPAADHGPTGWLQRLGGSAVVAATVRSLQLLGQQFVLGQTVDEALSTAGQQRARAADQGQRWCYSLDMLGEGARTHADAARYLASYRQALDHLSRAQRKASSDHPRDSLSIKLSALHPRLDPLHAESLMRNLLPSLTSLVDQALAQGISITLDAEESWRLELQLHILDRLLEGLAARHPRADNPPSVGLAVQAYQHRAPEAIAEVARLARQHDHRINVRLVKGAYWDSEVKRAQELGLPGFPVFTHKAHTDLSYLACARQLLSLGPWLKPQFATHNAATVAAVLQLAKLEGIPPSRLEWQRLHGMGESVWREILADPAVNAGEAPVMRIYAPVGSHRDLLAYLVRRLLENGANASFIHQLVDREASLDTLLASPLLARSSVSSVRKPSALYGPDRPNSPGRDLHHAAHRDGLQQALLKARNHVGATKDAVASSTDTDTVAPAMQALQEAWSPWAAQAMEARCLVLERTAQALESNLDSWAADLVIEARKTWSDAVSEVRETIDYARYYALQAREWLAPRLLPGPTGERNEWLLRPRGVWVCIAPWNFPLAIFGGQVMAALVSGNAVAAKPAPQTPRIARRLVNLLHEMGVHPGALTCLPGGASVGDALVRDRHCAGVVFTGSQMTARLIQQALVQRQDAPIVPLIAETGGLNALIADSTALPEQLIDSVVSSAFGSAGQRCSALRLLCVHTAVAEDVEALLAGAMDTLVVGDAAEWTTDIGPVIDEQARARLLEHVNTMDAACLDQASGVRLVGQARLPSSTSGWPSCFVVPRAYAMRQVADLKEEHFGPLLHVVRWGPGTCAPTLDELIDQINASGHGLTLGVHTRIDSRAEHVARRIRAGNIYVNRGMTGAVVGVQPFGGQGLSGTGPKAGGPLYLPRFCTEQVVCTNTAAAGGDAQLMSRAG